MSRRIFRPLHWDQEPFSEQGVRWFERAPSSLIDEDWKQLKQALLDGRISWEEYTAWRDTEEP